MSNYAEIECTIIVLVSHEISYIIERCMWGDSVEHHKKIRNYITISFLSILMVVFSPHLIVQASTENAPQSERIPFYIVAAIIGGIIIVTLTYVSWKKYKAEQKKKNKNENS